MYAAFIDCVIAVTFFVLIYGAATAFVRACQQAARSLRPRA